jgi:hypothetical protein
MGFVLKRVANREWRVFRDRQPVRRGKRSPDATPRVALHLRMVFEPQKEAFFELAVTPAA